MLSVKNDQILSNLQNSEILGFLNTFQNNNQGINGGKQSNIRKEPSLQNQNGMGLNNLNLFWNGE